MKRKLKQQQQRQQQIKTKQKQASMEIQNFELEAEIEKRERLGSCEVCDITQAKYTCPRCEVHTCSLNCSKIHKKELECSGVRDKTKYIPLSKMTAMDFMNDYYFLEEASRFTSEVKTNRNVKNYKKLKNNFIKLKNAASARQIKLYFINAALSKRGKNLTTYNASEDVIVWHVDFHFMNADFKTLAKVNENKKIKDVIRDIMSRNEDVKQLDFYRAQESKIRVLLRAEGMKKSGSRYYQIDAGKSLKSNLARKVVIEFPTVYVTMDYCSNDFEIISSDDEGIENEQKEFSKTLKEEVFNKKLIQNPLLVVNPEEVPIISDILNEDSQREVKGEKKYQRHHKESDTIVSKVNATPHDNGGNNDDDDYIAPENYFFAS